MYRNMNQPAGFYGPQTSIYPQINTPIANPTMYAQNASTVLPGRMVDKAEDITVGEVPLDGSLGLFFINLRANSIGLGIFTPYHQIHFHFDYSSLIHFWI